MSEFKDKAITGVSWSIAGQVGHQALAFAIGIILARLLSPDEFGLLAMITVVTGFAQVFAELGFGAALVQKRDLLDEHLSSVFWINVGSGALLTILFALGAPLLSTFYDEPILTPLTRVMALSFFFGSLGIVQQALFTRKIDFRTISIVEVVAVVVAGGVGIGAAYTGWGVWSLAARAVLSTLVTTVLLWVLSPWRPRFSVRWSALRDLLGFSANLLGEKSLNYWVRNLDDLLVGKVIGTGALGVYNRAYAVMLFPLQNISRVISRVMFPSLATIQDDRPRVKRVFLAMTRTIALVTFPAMLGLLVTARPFVLAVFGPDWAAMIPLLQILSVVGLIQSIVTLVGNLFLSQGRADLMFRVGLLTKPILVVGIVAGLRWGVLGVATGYTLAVSVSQYVNLRVAGRLVGLTYLELVRHLAGVFACAVAMAGLLYGVRLVLPEAWSVWPLLCTQVLVGAIFYATLLHAFDLEAYRETRRLVAERWSPP